MPKINSSPRPGFIPNTPPADGKDGLLVKPSLDSLKSVEEYKNAISKNKSILSKHLEVLQKNINGMGVPVKPNPDDFDMEDENGNLDDAEYQDALDEYNRHLQEYNKKVEELRNEILSTSSELRKVNTILEQLSQIEGDIIPDEIKAQVAEIEVKDFSIGEEGTYSHVDTAVQDKIKDLVSRRSTWSSAWNYYSSQIEKLGQVEAPVFKNYIKDNGEIDVEGYKADFEKFKKAQEDIINNAKLMGGLQELIKNCDETLQKLNDATVLEDFDDFEKMLEEQTTSVGDMPQTNGLNGVDSELFNNDIINKSNELSLAQSNRSAWRKNLGILNTELSDLITAYKDAYQSAPNPNDFNDVDAYNKAVEAFNADIKAKEEEIESKIQEIVNLEHDINEKDKEIAKLDRELKDLADESAKAREANGSKEVKNEPPEKDEAVANLVKEVITNIKSFVSKKRNNPSFDLAGNIKNELGKLRDEKYEGIVEVSIVRGTSDYTISISYPGGRVTESIPVSMNGDSAVVDMFENLEGVTITGISAPTDMQKGTVLTQIYDAARSEGKLNDEQAKLLYSKLVGDSELMTAYYETLADFENAAKAKAKSYGDAILQEAKSAEQKQAEENAKTAGMEVAINNVFSRIRENDINTLDALKDLQKYGEDIEISVTMDSSGYMVTVSSDKCNAMKQAHFNYNCGNVPEKLNKIGFTQFKSNGDYSNSNATETQRKTIVAQIKADFVSRYAGKTVDGVEYTSDQIDVVFERIFADKDLMDPEESYYTIDTFKHEVETRANAGIDNISETLKSREQEAKSKQERIATVKNAINAAVGKINKNDPNSFSALKDLIDKYGAEGVQVHATIRSSNINITISYPDGAYMKEINDIPLNGNGAIIQELANLGILVDDASVNATINERKTILAQMKVEYSYKTINGKKLSAEQLDELFKQLENHSRLMNENELFTLDEFKSEATKIADQMANNILNLLAPPTADQNIVNKLNDIFGELRSAQVSDVLNILKDADFAKFVQERKVDVTVLDTPEGFKVMISYPDGGIMEDFTFRDDKAASILHDMGYNPISNTQATYAQKLTVITKLCKESGLSDADKQKLYSRLYYDTALMTSVTTLEEFQEKAEDAARAITNELKKG